MKLIALGYNPGGPMFNFVTVRAEEHSNNSNGKAPGQDREGEAPVLNTHGGVIPPEFFHGSWKESEKKRFKILASVCLESYNHYVVFLVQTGLLQEDQLGMCWDVGPWTRAIEINTRTIRMIDETMIHGVIAHEVNHTVTCIMDAIQAHERAHEPEAYLTQQLVDFVTLNLTKESAHD